MPDRRETAQPMPAHSLPPYAAALLCGGQSRRMGRDKAWLPWQGEPLWRAQLAKLRALSPPPSRLLIACREAQEIHAPGAAVLWDPPGNAGPLPALLRCLEQVRPLPLLVLGVDMPEMRPAFLQPLLHAALPSGNGFVCRDGSGPSAHFEPLAACYPASVIPLLHEAVAAGDFRLQHVVQRATDAGLLQVHHLSPSEAALFANLNSPEDLPAKAL